MKSVGLVGTLLALALPSAASPQTVVTAVPRVTMPVAPFTITFDNVLVTEGDIADKPYTELGTITAKKGKPFIVSKSPTREDVAEKLAKRARKMGADAVIRVNFGPAGVSFGSWGDFKGEGIAINSKSSW